jgi:hypothetical protein
MKSHFPQLLKNVPAFAKRLRRQADVALKPW